MKSIVRWAIGNSPAMNTLMISILAVGLVAGITLRREEFPRFELEVILITVPYPGASPDEVESGVCQKIEEAVRAIDGVKKASIKVGGKGDLKLKLQTVKMDLSNADQNDHDVTLRVSIGSYSDRHTRRWTVKGTKLLRTK